ALDTPSAAPSLQRLRSLEALMPAMTPGTAGAPRPVPDLRRALEGRAFVSFFEADDDLWLLAGPTGRWHRLERRESQIAADVDTFLTRPDDADLAARLGAELLPHGALPAPGETLYIVTDGALGRLPFAALRHSGRFLVQRHPLALVPSLEALAALAERPQPAPGPALILGDPTGDLPEARSEAIAVAAQLDTKPYLGPAANHEALRHTSRPRVLHLATHTGLGPGGPWISLADGPLPADLLVTDGLAPRLAVLATCASAARPGREMWGSLAAVFLAAGSETVLATLVSVQDDVAARLALAFYQHGGPDQPALALARVQRDFIERGRPASEWAPFVILGLG
ncbi:MAG: CHAT domain-containing protein, partial [Acidobacteriota bacterium]